MGRAPRSIRESMRTSLLLLLVGCTGSASARLEMANQSVTGSNVLADGTSLRLRMIAAYLAADVDPMTMNNIGDTAMIWINPECSGDISGCNISGFTQPAGGPRVTQYFDLSRPTAEVNADLDSQDNPVPPGTYRYARVELCKAYPPDTVPTEPTMFWAGPGMASEQPFTSGDCGRTSLAFDPPLVLADGDAVTVRLGYDLARSIVSGPPHPDSPHCSLAVAGYDNPDGTPHCFRTCAATDAGLACMDFPDFAPTAARLN